VNFLVTKSKIVKTRKLKKKREKVTYKLETINCLKQVDDAKKKV